jgi:hypothetical protein
MGLSADKFKDDIEKCRYQQCTRNNAPGDGLEAEIAQPVSMLRLK